MSGPAEPFGPGTMLWDLAGDIRFLLVFPAGLLMQAAHPVVGHAVGAYSVALTDPWGRATRSLDSVHLWVYGGEAALAEGKRLRELHRPIRGVIPEDGGPGKRYTALQPEPYSWVHGTAFYLLVTGCRLFAKPLRPAEEERLYEEVRRLGRILGVREEWMPRTVAEYWQYFDRMVTTKLVDHPTVREVMALARKPPAPPCFRGPLKLVWWPIARLAGPLNNWITTGVFPPALRETMGLRWTAQDERRLRLLGTVVRCIFALLPERLRYFPMPFHARRLARAQARIRARATVSLADRVAAPHLRGR